MRSMRVGFCAAVIAAAGVAVAACGTSSPVGAAANPSAPSSPSAKTPVQAIEAAYTSTTAASTAKISIDMAISGSQLNGQKIDFSGSGVMDFAHKQGDMTMNILGMSAEIRYLDGVEYMHLPSGLGNSGGKPWMKIDLNELTKAGLGKSMDQLTSSTPTDPSQMLSYLRGLGSDIVDDGPATIDGTPTTHYSATMNLDTFAKQENISADKIAQLRQALGGNTVPMQLWLDGQNRLRQMSYDEKINAGAITGDASGAGSGTVDMAMTMNLSDFGVPVTVTAPPADQTEDAVNALGNGGK